MRHVATSLTLLALGMPLVAQEARQQSMAVAIPAYTDAQRWNRETVLAVGFYASTIAYGKARGQTVDEVGRWFGDSYAPGWGPANTGHAVRAARGFVLNMAAMPNTEPAIVSATDSSATLRYRRTHVAMFGATGVMYGVSVAEYDRFFDVVGERIASHLGLRYASRVDGEWSVITFTGRGSNALSAFPRSTFTVTVSPEQAMGAMAAGTYDVTFAADGGFQITGAGQTQVRGRYHVWLDQVTISDETGPWITAPCAAGTYRFTPQSNGDVIFGRLTDTCEGRARFFARRLLKK